MHYPDIHEQRCDEKTARGNKYRTIAKARRAAIRAHCREVKAYLCPFCHFYHIGKSSREIWR